MAIRRLAGGWVRWRRGRRNDCRPEHRIGTTPEMTFIQRFSEYFDGFTIDSNDLTQLALGVNHEWATAAHLCARHPAVKTLRRPDDRTLWKR